MLQCKKNSQIIYVILIFTAKSNYTKPETTQVTLKIMLYVVKCLLNNYRALVSAYKFPLCGWLVKELQLLPNHSKHIPFFLSCIF